MGALHTGDQTSVGGMANSETNSDTVNGVTIRAGTAGGKAFNVMAVRRKTGPIYSMYFQVWRKYLD